MPNVWLPNSTLPGFQDFIKHFYAECWKTSQLVLRALALGLGLENEYFLLQFHDERENEVSLRHYPPVSERQVESGEMDRLGAHTDFDSFTLLFQDQFGGLKVKHPTTKAWIDAVPIEGALVMNIGDVLARWSNSNSTIIGIHMT
jgi:isopenicillin N synthase-like dioxygenase